MWDLGLGWWDLGLIVGLDVGLDVGLVVGLVVGLDKSPSDWLEMT